MELARLRTGEWIAAVSGVVLAVSLFLPWYEVEVPPHGGARDVGGTVDLTAWEVFSVVDVLLLLLGLAAVALLVVTASQPTAAVGIASDALLTILAGVMAVVTTTRLINLPGALEEVDRLGVDPDRAPFAFMGLAAMFGVLAGCVIAMRDERLSRPGERTDATGLPISEAPEIEVIPSPPRGSAGGRPSAG
jgi:hypothetical protein